MLLTGKCSLLMVDILNQVIQVQYFLPERIRIICDFGTSWFTSAVVLVHTGGSAILTIGQESTVNMFTG